ncbi:MAG: Na+-transporting NADH:ubiquinone oxidoreductase subunit D [Ruminococcaceae bacterium]|nr:Na+-transporting NADH:ubiquinone oxidoreductase subunit D [Oscillospiraceae bacterium]
MSALSTVTVSPHIHGGKSTGGIMRDVLISLLPATIAGTVIFGWRALAVVAVCVVCCVGFEALFNLAIKKEQTIGDLSAAVTGLLLALNLPVDVPLWQCAVGSLFAIILVKCFFGGIGSNLVNPAITARVFMLVAFSSLAVPSFPADAVSSATPLSAETMPSLLDLFLGNRGGAIGETCILALLLGGIYLLVRRVITWHIPVLFIATVFVFSFFMEGFDAVAALSLIMSGGLFIGAFFMATDYTTSPYTPWGKVIFAVGAGLLTCLIRYFGTYPEGVSFAILFMNILNPYICKWTKRKVFAAGGEKK